MPRCSIIPVNMISSQKCAYLYGSTASWSEAIGYPVLCWKSLTPAPARVICGQATLLVHGGGLCSNRNFPIYIPKAQQLILRPFIARNAIAMLRLLWPIGPLVRKVGATGG